MLDTLCELQVLVIYHALTQSYSGSKEKKTFGWHTSISFLC